MTTPPVTPTRSDRLALIGEIENDLNTRILVLITGNRQGMEARIAGDAFLPVFNKLSEIGLQESICLFLYSMGGITMDAFGLVNLIREFCDSFEVIVPFRALSAATLMCLGGDKIVMTRLAQLGPVDPSVESPLGPQVQLPQQPGVAQLVPVNVEDAVSFIDFAKKEANLKQDESLAGVFDRLATSVHPLALGAVNRAREQIRFLARQLLSSHMKDEKKIELIISAVTKERFSHNYLIGRREAKEVLGLNLEDVAPPVEERIIRLFNMYERLLSLSVPYNQEMVLGPNQTVTATFDRGVIETTHGDSFVYRTVRQITRITTPTVGYQETTLREGWISDANI
ncbi:MAG: serine protease [Candidatus Bathyarchaeia archaeon]